MAEAHRSLVEAGQELGGAHLAAAQHVEPRHQVIQARIDLTAPGDDLGEQYLLAFLGVPRRVLGRPAVERERLSELLLAAFHLRSEVLSGVLADVDQHDGQFLVRGPDGVIDVDEGAGGHCAQVLDGGRVIR